MTVTIVFTPATRAKWAFTNILVCSGMGLYPQNGSSVCVYIRLWSDHRGTNLRVSYTCEAVCAVNQQSACFCGHRVVFWVVFPFNNYEKLGASNIGMRNAVKLQQVARSFPSSESRHRQMKSNQ